MSQKLPPEEQEACIATLEKKGDTSLINQLILQGIIDPPAVRFHRKACAAFLTQDADTTKLKQKAIRLTQFDEPVLVLGESGTGKELLASILHGERKGYFVPVNVCAVTETLFESELFGHIRGAFTGADKDRDGLIKHAEGGTLFLDEIGDMPVVLQAKLLRVINNRVYRKVGSNVDLPLQCRILAATHRDLPAMVKQGSFRLDLLERLQVFRLRIKPLRERLCDIELYVGKEFNEFLHTFGVDNFKFDGNIRQLLNLKRRYDIFGAEEISREDLL